MGKLIVRRGDAGSHGGQVSTGSTGSLCEGKGIARQNDTYACPIHGDNPITQVSGNSKCNGRGIVRDGDQAQCGATMISGASKSYVN